MMTFRSRWKPMSVAYMTEMKLRDELSQCNRSRQQRPSDRSVYEHWGERTERKRRAERVIGVVHDPCELEVLHGRRLHLDRRATMSWGERAWRSPRFRCCYDWRPRSRKRGPWFVSAMRHLLSARHVCGLLSLKPRHTSTRAQRPSARQSERPYLRTTSPARMRSNAIRSSIGSSIYFARSTLRVVDERSRSRRTAGR